MTSRESTSGFDFWSRGRNAYSREIWCRYLYLIRSYWYFSESLLDVWQISNRGNSANTLYRLKLKIWKLRALIVNQRNYYVSDIRVIFITTTMSRKKSSGFEFWSCVIYAWPWCIGPSNLLTFSEIQDGGRYHLRFSSRVHLVHSVMLIVWCVSSIWTTFIWWRHEN